MTVRVYKSTDDGAPVLNGLAGSLITVLDAVLVNGYGTMAAAGWTKPFSGTNKAVYRSSTANGGSGLYYRFQDDGTRNYLTGSGTASRIVAVRGYESMTTVDTGTNAFPTTSLQGANYSVWQKSATNDMTVRDWIIIADQYTAHILIDASSNLTATGGYLPYSIGEFYSYKSNFSWKGSVVIEGSSQTPFWMEYQNSGGTSGLYVPRKHDDTVYTSGGTGMFCNFTSTKGSSTQGSRGVIGVYTSSTMIPYPHPIDGRLYMSKIYVSPNDNVPIGYIRGIYAPLHVKPLQNGDIFYGTGSLSEKTFQVFRVRSSSTVDAQMFIEISDTWAYNV